ncbi:MAG: RNA polymerase sigma factor [Solirubrobacterales bacterium]
MQQLTEHSAEQQAAGEAPKPSGDDFAILFADSRDDLFAYLAYLTGDRGLAEELTAAAFEKAFRKRGLFRPGRGDLRGWIFGIARNMAIDALRSGSRESALDLQPETADGRDEHGDVDERLALIRAMRTLQARDRELIALKFFAGLDNDEIARVMKISRSNAGTQLHRAMSRLRTQMEGTRDEA